MRLSLFTSVLAGLAQGASSALLSSLLLSSSNITVDVSQTFQTIRGLGYSEAFQRAQWVYNTMSSVRQQEMFDLLHDPVTGAGLSILRIGIGSSPNNTGDHMTSIEPVSPGLPENSASYVWDRNDSSQVWWAKEVQKRGVNLFYGNSWGADYYMKDNNSTDNGGHLCGVNGTDCVTGDWRQQYADKLVQWVKYYAEEGINITHLGPLNEPDISVPYASMQADGYQTSDMLAVLKPAVEEAGLTSVKITCCDWAGWENGRGILAEMQEAGGEAFTDVISSHGYGQPLGDPFDTEKEVWQTEWAELSSYFDQPWYSVEGDTRGTYGGGEGLTWANRILQGFTVANVSAFINWMGAQPSNAATPLIRTINDTNIVSKRYYAYAAFGRYARPGSERVHASSTVSNVTVAAFTAAEGFAAGGNLALQIINNADETAAVPVVVDTIMQINSATAYLVNNDYDLAEDATLVEIEGTSLAVTVPARSLAVLVVDGQW
ncbi:glycoside hydrolase superfamily [Truncatella angustata]|uniref:Glycoside hydrolase superfamily n=1 Tax=Truncatella angustata TaxID=152316 RepID=A0A9P8UPQ5_9PEZI|nr:glycoside hydrolase superfamily [Truncatella angustata]KAH6655804.1 glycoside hydrolase superfamily [Truncatella angustata]